MFQFSNTTATACVTSGGRTVSYCELDGLAGRIGALMESHRLVFCLCSNTVGSIAGYVAFLRNDDAALMLEAGMSEESYLSLYQSYRPRYVWAPASCHLIVNGTDADRVSRLLDVEGYVLWDTGDSTTDVADELALMLTTSGYWFA